MKPRPGRGSLRPGLLEDDMIVKIRMKKSLMSAARCYPKGQVFEVDGAWAKNLEKGGLAEIMSKPARKPRSASRAKK